MKTWIDALQQSLADVLDATEFAELAAALHTPAPTSLRHNPNKLIRGNLSGERIPWHPRGQYINERPRFDQELDFHLGSYYVQEASSMFLYYVLQQLPHAPEKILDLCAAPGGKSTDLIDAFPDALLISNEVVPSRRAILEENLIKWGRSSAWLSGGSAAQFGQLQEFFDLILIDAPCSGEGMLRKSENAQKQYNATLVKQCAARQSKILDQVLPALKPGGHLIYSTCTWNRQENEAHFLFREKLEGVQLNPPREWNIANHEVQGSDFCRLFPHRVGGEGLTISAWQKVASIDSAIKRVKTPDFRLSPAKSKQFSHSEAQVWRDDKGNFYLSQRKDMVAMRTAMNHIGCHPIVTLGRLDRRNNLIPHIALAQQIDLDHNYSTIAIDEELALRYIKKEDLPKLGDEGQWQCLQTRDLPLGWIKNLARRANNYYPKSRAI